MNDSLVPMFLLTVGFSGLFLAVALIFIFSTVHEAATILAASIREAAKILRGLCDRDPS